MAGPGRGSNEKDTGGGVGSSREMGVAGKTERSGLTARGGPTPRTARKAVGQHRYTSINFPQEQSRRADSPLR